MENFSKNKHFISTKDFEYEVAIISINILEVCNNYLKTEGWFLSKNWLTRSDKCLSNYRMVNLKYIR